MRIVGAGRFGGPARVRVCVRCRLGTHPHPRYSPSSEAPVSSRKRGVSMRRARFTAQKKKRAKVPAAPFGRERPTASRDPAEHKRGRGGRERECVRSGYRPRLLVPRLYPGKKMLGGVACA